MTEEDVFSHILTAAREVTPIIDELVPAEYCTNLNKGICFVDLGINSIDYVEIVTKIMENLNVDIPMCRFVNTNNIQEAVEIFHQAVNDSCNLVSDQPNI